VRTVRRALHQGRAAACEGVEDALARAEVPTQERLDELGHELAEVGVQPVHMLGAHALRQVVL
jgi:hypothetical protein